MDPHGDFPPNPYDEILARLPGMEPVCVHRTSPHQLRYFASNLGQMLDAPASIPAFQAGEEGQPILESLWDVPAPFMQVGSVYSASMQAGATLQEEAELSYARDIISKNMEMCRLLGLRTLALTVADESIVSLKGRIAALEAGLAEEQASSARLKFELGQQRERIVEYEAKDAALDRINFDVWEPMGRRAAYFQDQLPVLLDSPCTDSYMDQPLQLGRVVRDMGFVCKPTELRRLGALAYHAFARVHGTAPVARVFYVRDGSPQRVSCFTRRDRDLVINVITEHRGKLFSSPLQGAEDEHEMD